MNKLRYAMLALILLGSPAGAGAAEDAASVAKKCKLEAQVAENSKSLETLKQLLANANQDAKVVGYTTLGTQADINRDKRQIHTLEKENAELRSQLKQYKKIETSPEICTGATQADLEQRKGGAMSECQDTCKKNPDKYNGFPEYCLGQCLDDKGVATFDTTAPNRYRWK